MKPGNWRGEDALLAQELLKGKTMIHPQTPKVGFFEILPTGEGFDTLQVPEGESLIPHNWERKYE